MWKELILNTLYNYFILNPNFETIDPKMGNTAGTCTGSTFFSIVITAGNTFLD